MSSDIDDLDIFLGDELDAAVQQGRQDASVWCKFAKAKDLLRFHVDFYERYSPHRGLEGEEWLSQRGSTQTPLDVVAMSGPALFQWLQQNYPHLPVSVQLQHTCGRDVILEAWALAFEQAAAKYWHDVGSRAVAS